MVLRSTAIGVPRPRATACGIAATCSSCIPAAQSCCTPQTKTPSQQSQQQLRRQHPRRAEAAIALTAPTQAAPASASPQLHLYKSSSTDKRRSARVHAPGVVHFAIARLAPIVGAADTCCVRIAVAVSVKVIEIAAAVATLAANAEQSQSARPPLTRTQPSPFIWRLSSVIIGTSAVVAADFATIAHIW